MIPVRLLILVGLTLAIPITLPHEPPPRCFSGRAGEILTEITRFAPRTAAQEEAEAEAAAAGL